MDRTIYNVRLHTKWTTPVHRAYLRWVIYILNCLQRYVSRKEGSEILFSRWQKDTAEGLPCGIPPKNDMHTSVPKEETPYWYRRVNDTFFLVPVSACLSIYFLNYFFFIIIIFDLFFVLVYKVRSGCLLNATAISVKKEKSCTLYSSSYRHISRRKFAGRDNKSKGKKKKTDNVEFVQEQEEKRNCMSLPGPSYRLRVMRFLDLCLRVGLAYVLR